jgi:hypothetical protein
MHEYRTKEIKNKPRKNERKASKRKDVLERIHHSSWCCRLVKSVYLQSFLLIAVHRGSCPSWKVRPACSNSSENTCGTKFRIIGEFDIDQQGLRLHSQPRYHITFQQLHNTATLTSVYSRSSPFVSGSVVSPQSGVSGSTQLPSQYSNREKVQATKRTVARQILLVVVTCFLAIIIVRKFVVVSVTGGRCCKGRVRLVFLSWSSCGDKINETADQWCRQREAVASRGPTYVSYTYLYAYFLMSSSKKVKLI